MEVPDVDDLLNAPRPEPTSGRNAPTLGPLSLLEDALKDRAAIVVSCRNNHKLVGRVVAYDHHCNMILEGVKDLWNDSVKNSKGEVAKTVPRERYVHKMFLRGDGVIIVLRA